MGVEHQYEMMGEEVDSNTDSEVARSRFEPGWEVAGSPFLYAEVAANTLKMTEPFASLVVVAKWKKQLHHGLPQAFYSFELLKCDGQSAS